MPTKLDATVLVVEDEPLVLMLAADVLEDEGLTVLTAENGDDGLLLLKVHREIDLLVTDVNLPGVDGCTLAAQAVEDRPDLALIVTSGRNRFRNDELPDNGDFLPKPYTPSQLLEVVRRKLAE